MPGKLTHTVESPVRYPAALHTALDQCRRIELDQWVLAIAFEDESDARAFYRKLNTFAHSWAKHPSYDPLTTQWLWDKKITGKVRQIAGEWKVFMRVRQLSTTWENIF